MQNQEYALAIPLAHLYAAAREADPQCRLGRAGATYDCARARVESMLCPCIRGDECVCRVLAEEFETRVRCARTGRASEPSSTPEC